MRMLYKYVSNPENILKDGFIRATQLSALNDPFEAVYSSEGLKELASNFDFETGDEFIKYIDENKHKVGVISLTESKDNLLMWSHYANEHKGVILGFHTSCFDKSHPFENLFKLRMRNTNFLEGFELFRGDCYPVIYRKQPRYKVDMYDFDYSNISAEGCDRILFEIFQQKSDEWIYEKEHRITLRLEQADKVIVYDLEKISSKKALNDIIKSNFYEVEEIQDEVKHTIHLNKVLDSTSRELYASLLAELSENYRNLYLFKLASNSVSS
ncbi:DUF2971 domain-containing protein [Endozoicomonas sp. SCSIO W0465]|uniref:DUF2971 domain-containing protein n=1 Tax=Endozoicomonas sp. SCSIO W0465 TaxID=2918516 RepID=UPI002075A0D2|nr:DUF2971 domain-containing protein [Endozoicomonas sp. SCSIO W0465]USE38695.1 DUF2971 domain-containing protein [Endozoicomonas sp. SCSIO W0465]